MFQKFQKACYGNMEVHLEILRVKKENVKTNGA